MKTVWILLLFALSLQASVVYEGLSEDEECEKWEYHPMGDFLAPEFISAPSYSGVGYGEVKTKTEPFVEFYGPDFESVRSNHGNIELLDSVKPVSTPSSIYDDIELLDDVKTSTPSSNHYSDIELLDDVKTTPKTVEDFYGPQFAQGSLDDFHGPQFESTVKPVSVSDRYSDVELLDEVKTTQPSLEDFYGPQFESTVKPQLEDFYGPQFESTVKPVSSNRYSDIELLGVQKTTQPPLEQFHGPQFETTPSSEIEMFDSETTTQSTGTQRTESQEYGIPQFSPVNLNSGNSEVHYKQPINRGRIYKVHDEFASGRVSKPVVESVYAWPKSSKVQDQFAFDEIVDSKPKKKYLHRPVYRVHDGFAHDRVGETVFESAHNWPKSSKVQDQFAVETIEEEGVKHLRKQRPIYSAKPIHHVHDDFASARSDKVVIEPASLPPNVAKVQDEFAVEKKEERKPSKPFYYVAPITQFFFDLLAPRVAVHDSFSNDISAKTIVEPIVNHPKSKVAVHDEFLAKVTEGGDRSKRSASSDVWKLVCVKRRPKTKPIARTLTAADFSEYAHMANDRISRCIGRKEGENVAAGTCKKFYLRCAPIINVMMCSQLNEVFSEAKKTCVPKTESSECNLLREVESQKIVFSKKAEEEGVDDIEDPQEFCYDRADGFYQDNKNCSRVLQCFDNEFVEYPSCPEPLAFNLKRGKCDRRENVPSCINN